MAANMYRVGDYVYFETSSSLPYQVRRIEELNKTPNGNVEARVMCFYRRRDIPSSLLSLADRHQNAFEEDQDSNQSSSNEVVATKKTSENENSSSPSTTEKAESVPPSAAANDDSDPVESSNPRLKHQLKQRELFLSRQVETLPATHIRGKCSVTLFNETESHTSYIEKDDTFFYSLVYDPQQRTLLADRGEIRVGNRYQAEPTPLLKEGESDGRNCEDLETLTWNPSHSLNDRQIDQFLVISRSVGTFARALDCSSSVKQPSLHMSAASASRDVTLFHAMDLLHRQNYDLSAATCALVPPTGPVLCRDEMEEWSASEANLFEEALEKYGKDFGDVRQDFLPWKTLKNIVEYYYMWKTTDRYVQQKRVKAVEAESKLKQVYIPNHNKPHPAALPPTKGGVVNGSGSMTPDLYGGKPCESCGGTSNGQWYAWGPSQQQCRLCQNCWSYWKKYGGLLTPSKWGDEPDVKRIKSSGSDEERSAVHLAPHRPHRCAVQGCAKEFKVKSQLLRHCASNHGMPLRSGSPRPIMKTRTAFYLWSTPSTRLARRLCSGVIQTKHATRSPFWPINQAAVRQEYEAKLVGKTPAEKRSLLTPKLRVRGRVSDISFTLAKGQIERTVPQWLILTDKNSRPRLERPAFPKPPKGPDGSLIYERVPNKEVPDRQTAHIANAASSLIKRRAHDEPNHFEGPSMKRARETIPPAMPLPIPGYSPNLPLTHLPPTSPLPPYIPGSPALMPGLAAAAAAASTRAGAAPPGALPLIPDLYPAALGVGVGLKGSPGPVPVSLVAPRKGGSSVSGQPNGGRGMNRVAAVARMAGSSGRKQMMTWMDAPDDVYFQATKRTKKMRRQLTITDLRRAARKPWRSLAGKVTFPVSPMPPQRPISAPVVVLE